MKKWLTLLLILCMVLSTLPAIATDGSAFEMSKLEQYVDEQDNWALAFHPFTRGTDAWSYFLHENAMKHDFAVDGISGKLKVYIALESLWSDDAAPCLQFTGTADNAFSIHHVNILVGKTVYTITVTNSVRYGNVSESRYGDYDVNLYFKMGMAGIDLLNALQETGGACIFRLYYTDKAYIEIEQPPINNYGAFYAGLVKSGYLTSDGVMQPTTERHLTRLYDKERTEPSTSAAPVNGKIWPVITPVPTPLANINAQSLAEYETLSVGYKGDIVLAIRMRMYELGYFAKVPTQTEFTSGMVEYVHRFQQDNGLPVENVITPEMQALLFSQHALAKATPTPRPTAAPKPTATPYVEPAYIVTLPGYANWARYKGVPWVKQEVKNNSEVSTVTAVTFTYYCEDENDNRLTSVTGKKSSLVTIDLVIRPGRKVTTPQIKIEDYKNVKHLWMALYGYTLEDGTQVTLPEREQVYWWMEYR